MSPKDQRGLRVGGLAGNPTWEIAPSQASPGLRPCRRKPRCRDSGVFRGWPRITSLPYRPGTVYDDIAGRGCIPVSQCHCKVHGHLYLPGQQITNDCEQWWVPGWELVGWGPWAGGWWAEGPGLGGVSWAGCPGLGALG